MGRQDGAERKSGGDLARFGGNFAEMIDVKRGLSYNENVA